MHDHRCLARGKPGGRALGPVSRGTRRRPAVRPAHADTDTLTQHGPAAEGAAGPDRPRDDLRDPCRAIGDKGSYTVTVSPPTGRRPVSPRARNCPGTAVPGPVRGRASGFGLVPVRAVQTVAVREAQVSSRPLDPASLPEVGGRGGGTVKGRPTRADTGERCTTPVALRGKPGGRAPRHPVRDPPGDACRWSKDRHRRHERKAPAPSVRVPPCP